MDDIDTAPQNPDAASEPFAAPVSQEDSRLASAFDPSAQRAPAEGKVLPTGERVLDLIALLVLIALSAMVFTVAGPTAFTAVTSVGLALFATWRSTHRPPR